MTRNYSVENKTAVIGKYPTPNIAEMIARQQQGECWITYEGRVLNFWRNGQRLQKDAEESA